MSTAGTTKLYVDGQFVDESTNPPIYNTADWVLSLGDFVGDVDELRISSTVR